MPSLIARNVYGLPNSKRGPLARDKRRESRMDTQAWVDLERASVKMFGRDSGRAFVRVLREGEHDFDLFCTKLLGIKPLPWQTTVWNEGLEKHSSVVARMPNGVGKTTFYALAYFMAGTYRKWAPSYWGTYSMRHMGPMEEHAMRAYQKMDELLREVSREQAYRHRRPDGKIGYLYRPNLLAPFIRARKIEQREGFDFFGSSSLLSFAPTSMRAQSADGTDPFMLGWDEVRHERNVTYVVGTIIMPRFLRTPDGRFMTLYTPDAEGAAAELGELYRRGRLGRKGWWSFSIGLKEGNPTIREADYDRVMQDVPKRIRKQVFEGEEAQPRGAHFAKKDIDVMFFGEQSEDIDELGTAVCECGSCRDKTGVFPSVRERVTARCPLCREKTRGHEHPMVAFCDPASSAIGADGIAFMIADLEPPGFDGMEVVYAERLAEESSIGDVVAHASAIAELISGEVGYDRKGALGHAFEDDSYDMPGEFVPVQNDTWDQKTRRLDLVATLMSKRAIRMRDYTPVRQQLQDYRRKDLKIAQDFVMCLAGLAEIAKPYLPDRVFEHEAEPDKRDDEQVRLDGLEDPVYGSIDEEDLEVAMEIDA